jgi:ribosomal protein S18 acetylase RimI-like enzyme
VPIEVPSLRWSVTPLTWDTEFFGDRTAMVHLDADGDADALARLADSCSTAYLLCEATQVDAIHAAENHGFRLVDLRCVVELGTPVVGSVAPGITVREATEREIGVVADMAAQLHDNTRFANDPAIPGAKVAELYRRYILRDASTAGWSVLVAQRGGAIIGYATHGPNDRESPGDTGTIGLIGVAPEARGLGLGASLIAQGVQRENDAGRSRMSVVTQGGSRPALAMYQRAGFVVSRVDTWLHWHRGSPGS